MNGKFRSDIYDMRMQAPDRRRFAIARATKDLNLELRLLDERLEEVGKTRHRLRLMTIELADLYEVNLKEIIERRDIAVDLEQWAEAKTELEKLREAAQSGLAAQEAEDDE